MFAASCTEDVPTLALLVDEVNPVFRILLLLAFEHEGFQLDFLLNIYDM